MKTRKIVLVFIIILLLNCLVIENTFAIADIIDSGSEFLKRGEQGEDVISEESRKKTSSKVYNILLGVRNCGSSYSWSNFRSDIYFI